MSSVTIDYDKLNLDQFQEGIESMLTGAADALEEADTEIGKAFK